eukprot:TRINITY_DN4991_c0_g1_i1.p1 TRINITY_DN4991_c0_g1~~TRINITY_DN4991_c0_g1_i1.p1  ORF type:complete len:373 (+),score=86.58 TRINITY_DN4991_c0_g1_i1:137-1255(+)
MFLASFNSGDASRPSFFEMIAQQEMMPTLKPALRYAFNTLSVRHPRLDFFSRHIDEIFSVLLLLLENHHLRHYDASFSENFYGLKRVKVNLPLDKSKSGTTFSPIDAKNRYWALFFLVGLPYLKGKADQIYKEWFPLYNFSITSEDNSIESTVDLEGSVGWKRNLLRLKLMSIRAFKAVYPFVNAIYEGTFFLYQLAYLYNKIRYYTPFLQFEGVILKRLSIQEINAFATHNAKRRKERLKQYQGGPLPTLWKFVVSGYDLLLDYSKFLLPVAIFSFKFLEWWYTENKSSSNNNLPLPPPPQPPNQANTSLTIPEDKSLCPLCKEKRTNTASSVGGFLFCYPCLFNYVRDHKRCPISFLPMPVDRIRKIYDA